MKNYSTIKQRKNYFELGDTNSGGYDYNYRINDNHIMSVDFAGGEYSFRIGKIFGNKITWGEQISINLTSFVDRGMCSFTALSDSKGVFIWWDSNNDIRGAVMGYDLSDLTVDVPSNWGTQVTYTPSQSYPDTGTLVSDYLDTDKFVIGYSVSVEAGSGNRYLETCVGSVSNTTLTWGTKDTTSSFGTHALDNLDLKSLDTDKFVIGLDSLNGSYDDARIYGYTISGTTITRQDSAAYGPDSVHWVFDSICKYDSNNFIIGCHVIATAGAIVGFNFDGSSITQYTTATTKTSASNIYVARIKDNYFILLFDDGSSNYYAEMCSLDPIRERIVEFTETLTSISTQFKLFNLNTDFNINDLYTAVGNTTHRVLRILST